MSRKKSTPFRLAVLCGGPSAERGISLNSARSISDHLESAEIEIVPIYFDYRGKPFSIPREWLYSNTPSDFDFKLAKSAVALSGARLLALLRSCDLAFPAMHGKFGEDGGIQQLLEKAKIPFVGSSAAAAKAAYFKHNAQRRLAEAGFTTLGSLSFTAATARRTLTTFFAKNRKKRAVLKPSAGGSSIGVQVVSSVKEALAATKLLTTKYGAKEILIEPFCEGKEFTVVVLANRLGLPTALVPVEIQMSYADGAIFDFRRKYLPTHQATYCCPPEFPDPIVRKIEQQAEQLFSLFGLRDFARIDGWVLPNGEIWFSDINPISGMEQNSFLFIQAARIGLSHRDVLLHIIEGALKRSGTPRLFEREHTRTGREVVHVLFGGDTAERQVSVMSGTNAWLKLRRSRKFEPVPFFLDQNGKVWSLPYGLALSHTAEEIAHSCEKARKTASRDKRLREAVLSRLGITAHEVSEPFFVPKSESIRAFLGRTSTLLIGLHGGFGENGELQQLCRELGVAFTGSDAEASRVCMNKSLTGELVAALEPMGIFTAPKILADRSALEAVAADSAKKVWSEVANTLESDVILVKPNDDGCSAGVAVLHEPRDMQHYAQAALSGIERIPAGTLSQQLGVIEMPQNGADSVLFEPFIHTDKVAVIKNKVRWHKVSDWIEVTVGILGKRGKMHALNPSLTVASGDVLSVEEKFQGGTGINMTPPPAPFVSPKAIAAARERIEITAQHLGLQGYARIDAFMHRRTGELIIIEANTLPALTPSTVIYHQALAEEKPIAPRDLLEKIIELGQQASKGKAVANR